MKIFDLPNLFSNDLLHQLKFVVEFIILGLILLVFSGWLMLRVKFGRQLLGRAILITLAFYAGFILLILFLPATNTSYGMAQPVIVVFGLIYLFLLDGGLIFMRLVLSFSWFDRRRRKLVFLYGLAHVVVLGVLFYAFYLEPQWLEVTQTQVELAKLPPGATPFKIALISDIHMERWTQRDFDTIRQLDKIKPDLIVIAGDHINIDHYKPETYVELKRFFAALAPTARYGVYAVAGLTERYDLAGMLEGTGVTFIDESYTSVRVNGIDLYMVGIRSRRSENDAVVMRNVQKNIPKDALKFLLYHTPDLAREAAEDGYDFYFAGHTHGGQIALPFFGALFTASKYGRAYAAGLYNLGGEANTRLYVTRGLGLEGFNAPRARLFARPEISVITFVAAPTKA